MKVLWFTNTPSLYNQGQHYYHGGGWIESLEQLIADDGKIELGIAFFHATDSQSVKRANTTYFPVNRPGNRKNPLRNLIKNWSGQLLDNDFNDTFKKIVQDFHPDVIHVFGTEGPFATIQNHTNIPVVIHLQGLINPYLNAYFPINQSRLNFLMSPHFLKKNLIGSSPGFTIKRFVNQAKREAEILRQAKYVMGRTHWDKMVASLYNPHVKYFHVDEVLRPPFYQSRGKTYPPTNHVELSIISTLSPTIYKGIDVILRTAKMMTELSNIPFQWQIIGLDENDQLLKHFEKTEKISHRNVNVRCLGRKYPEELVGLLSVADIFVHPSYIDNSPNSVCEAQMLGLPVIACDVGGLSSLIDHGINGFLVPSNGVFEIAHYLKMLAQKNGLAKRIGQNASQMANQRHNRVRIVNDLKEKYSSLGT